MIKKIGIFIIIATLIIFIVPINTHALSSELIPTETYVGGLETYTPGSDSPQEVTDIVNLILGWVYYIGVFISFAALMVMGIKYILGSMEEKAQYKETLGPYAIGAVLIFGGLNILKLISTFITAIL